MRHAIPLLVILAFVAGCATTATVHQDPRAEYVAAAVTFAATVNQLAAMREQGAFDMETADRMTVVIAEGNRLLREWEAAILRGESPSVAKGNFAAIQKALYEYQKGR